MVQHDGLNIPLFELINSLCDTIDLVSPELADHHKRVGLIAFALASEIGLPEEERSDLLFAGNLHDIGALSLTDRLALLSFEGCETHQHAEIGALLLETFSPLAHLGELVRFHHARWENGAGEIQRGQEVPLGSHILHLSDRISMLIGTMDGISLLTRVPDIRARIAEVSGSMFSTVLVETFNELSSRESFWLGLAFPGHHQITGRCTHLRTFKLDTDGTLGLSRLFARIIDFRSRFTATHSNGVAASAETLARLFGWPAAECAQMRIAGLLHDLGKLAVSTELLEKPVGLTTDERALIRCHSYFTRRALENIRSFESITDWSADHHERIDGKGYPDHVGGRNLSIGSRIMAVSDVFTALTEDRPYRVGMDRPSTLKILDGMVSQKALDPEIVSILVHNFDELNMVRSDAQSEAALEYGEISGKVAMVGTGQA